MSVRTENKKIADLLHRISDLYGVKIQILSRQGASKKDLDELMRRKLSYQKASHNVAEWPRKITSDLKIKTIEGVGKSTVDDILQYLKTGEIVRLSELESEFG